MNFSPITEVPRLILTKTFNLLISDWVAITEMYLRIPWELIADHVVSAEHSLGTTGL